MSAPTQNEETALDPRDAEGTGARPDRPTLEGDDVAHSAESKDSLESKQRTRNGVRRRFITY